MGKNTFKIEFEDGETKSVSVNIINKYIEEIEIKNLDEGSTNGGDNEKKGMIYGKEYTLKVIKFRDNKEPKNYDSINWSYSYSKDDEIVVGNISQTGKEITFKTDDLDFCGNKITFYAYINNKENEAQLEKFHHYRFRWFDRKIIENEVLVRMKKPYLANQSNTPLCGMAAIMYVLAKINYKEYKKFILELHKKGVSTINSYNVDVSKSLHLLDVKPSDNDYPNSMPYCDWISFSTIRDKENIVRDFDGNGDWSFDGATLPFEIEKFAKNIFNATDIIDETNLIAKKSTLLWGDASSREIAKMQELYLKGYNVIMLIHTNMIYEIKSGFFSTIEHWVVFEGVIGGTISWDEYDFKVFTWGDIKDIIINPEVFSTNYYGYVAFK